MFKKSKKGYYFWEELNDFEGLIHGFSTRKFGDVNWKKKNSTKNLKNFCKELKISSGQIVKMEQVHGDSVVWITSKNKKNLIGSKDGLLTSGNGIFLVVTAADCVPVMFIDNDKKIIGIAHAGWKGVYSEIVKRMVDQMVEKGSKKSQIIAAIGPSIKICCYNVYKERASLFKDKFFKMKEITKVKDDKIFLDLPGIVINQLRNEGILQKNILDCGMCTKDNHSDFFSFRKEGGTKSFGLFSGVIGYEKN
ncbi:MAG: hypothetical protein ACD_50C00311G0005 [uncultured bacterium]|nr:MAG: hypothetical protein ACD_50C00311G0005 [uncultured bacterium]OGH13868.1 MAG: hypothetical protein A2687_04880 [Candidatus Levybacteria bacterium RIFCSPHIGHO2_01_FULL_38_26]